MESESPKAEVEVSARSRSTQGRGQ